MTKQALNTVLSLLPLLTAAEREMVGSRIRLLGTPHQTGSVDPVAQVHRLLCGLVHGGFPPLNQLRKAQNWYRFERGCLRLQQFVDELGGGNLGRRRNQVLIALISCLIADLKRQRIAVGPTVLGDKMLHVFEVVNAAYPGYLESGLLCDALLHNL